MAKIIAICNQKGGVAKTTTTYNLAALCAMKGKKVLMIDLDSQGSLTISAGMEPLEYQNENISIAMNSYIDKRVETISIKSCIFPVKQIPKLYICPSLIDLASTEKQLVSATAKERVLGKILQEVLTEYEYIFIDCAPSLGNLTLNALACADYLLIPCETDYLAYRGLTDLICTVEEVTDLINGDLKIIGVVATKFEKGVIDANDVLDLLNKNFNVIGVIKKSSSIKKGIYDGLPVVSLNITTPQAKDIITEYQNVANYIMNL